MGGRFRLFGWAWSACLVLLVLGGYVSSSYLIARPIHLYAAVVLAVGMVGAALIRRPVPGWQWLAVLWLTYTLAVIAHAGQTEYAHDKVIQLFTSTLLAAVVPLWLLRDRDRAKRWLWSLGLFAGAVSVLAYLHPTSSYRLVLAGTNYIGSGRIINLALALTLLALVLRAGPRLVLLPLVAVTGYLGVSTGSRGPLLAAVGCAVAVTVFRRGTQRGRGVRILAIAALIAGGAFMVTQSQGYAESRLLGLSGADSSVQARVSLYGEAAHLGFTHPFGVGWGNLYPNLTLYGRSAVQGTDAYAHNLMLEVWSEAGWLALIVTVAFVIAALRSLWLSSHDDVGAALFGVGVYFTANALVSTDLVGNRAMFAALAFGWCARQWAERSDHAAEIAHGGNEAVDDRSIRPSSSARV